MKWACPAPAFRPLRKVEPLESRRVGLGSPPSGVLQRKCACGGSPGADGECEECRKKRLQRKSSVLQPAAPSGGVVPPIVHEVLRASGQPLEAATRAFMEPRFGHDFSRVRVFADASADNAARAVQARAYTIGRNIVFGAGEYAPGSVNGKRLLAHELTHVVQQSAHGEAGAASRIGPANDPAETEADRVAEMVASSTAAAPAKISQATQGIISRQGHPSHVNCPAGRRGAPADAAQILDTLKISAMLATTLADADLSLLQLDAVLPGLGAGGGFTMPAGPRLQHYQNRFGLPPAAGGGKFRNRLSGATFPSQAQALVEEAKSLQDRYSKISDFLGGSTIRFLCITNTTTIGGCTADCAKVDAFGCPTTLIMLCPGFWQRTTDGQSQLLVHEVAHTIFGIVHGRNFTHADCYAAYAADARGIASPTAPVCTP